MTNDALDARCLVVGYGSIGRRHHRVLESLGCSVGVVSSRDLDVASVYVSPGEGIERHTPDYVVLANPTSRHVDALVEVRRAGHVGPVLVEKPIASRLEDVAEFDERDVFVGYNLRFHPAFEQVREALAMTKPLAVHAYAGQYLPDWRPGRRYQDTSSALQSLGGGVLRDLSHELDLVSLLIGSWHRVVAAGGRRSSLEIETDDLWSMIMTSGDGTIGSVHLDYLNRPGQRTMTIVGEDGTIRADLMTGDVDIDGQTTAHEIDRDLTYRRMHRAVLEGDAAVVASAADGVSIVGLIDAIEVSAATGSWVSR